MTYLWINLSDLSEAGTIPGFGSPLNLMIKTSLGDDLLPNAYAKPDVLDEAYVVVCTSEDRAKALREALEVIFQRKVGRTIRTRTTQNPPTSTWERIST